MDAVFVSGRSSLDFIGTRKWRRTTPEEHLLKPSDLGEWAVAGGLIDAAQGGLGKGALGEIGPAKSGGLSEPGTRGNWDESEPGKPDALSKPSALGDLDEGDLTAGIELREAIYRVLTARLGATAPAAGDIAMLNRVAAHPPLTLTLTESGTVQRRGHAPELLSSLARDALDLLGSDLLAKVRECDRTECTRLFVDTSRTQNRRWCGMSECGNRAKVRAFRRRQH